MTLPTVSPSRAPSRHWFGVLVACVTMAGGACAGAPWFLGAPLDDRTVIPAQSRALTVAEHRRAADAARASHSRVIEVAELFALEDRGALRPAEEKRLVELLTARIRDWVALGRPIPLAEDLRHVGVLAPGRVHVLAPRLRNAEIAAGDTWLAVGENARAEEEYRRAEKLGSDVTDFRFRAAWGASVADLDIPTIERALSELPERVLAPFTRQYLDRAPATKPRLLKRAWLAARLYGPTELCARIEALPSAVTFRKPAEAVEVRSKNDGDDDGGAMNELNEVAPPKAPQKPVLIEPAADDLLYGGATLARALIPAAIAFPRILDPGPRSRAWAERLVAEDPTSTDSLEIAAVIDARAGRLGGAARKLTDLVFFSSDRAAAYERAAHVWERAGQLRKSCAAWNRATRVGAPDDPRWCDLLACVKQDPGAGDAEAVAAHIRVRAPALACVAPPASQGGGPDPVTPDVPPGDEGTTSPQE